METIMELGALGVYVKALRERRGMSQEQLANAVEVTTNTIWRVEAGRQEPRTSLLSALLAVLRGRARDVQELLKAGATAERARALADEAITESAILAAADTDPKRRALLQRIAELSEDPDLTQRIEDYLRGLETGRRARPGE